MTKKKLGGKMQKDKQTTAEKVWTYTSGAFAGRQ
jgi:hypothetical protein